MADGDLGKQIDAALGRYYAQKKVDGYFDDDGVGKFMAEAWDKAGTRLYSKVPGKKRVVAYFVWLEEGFPVWATSKARSSARKIETLWSV